MGPSNPGTNQLQVLRAIEDGWQAFCRAPWSFLLFQVLVLVVALPFAGLATAGGLRLASQELLGLHPIAAGLALVVGAVGYVVVILWGLVGGSDGGGARGGAAAGQPLGLSRRGPGVAAGGVGAAAGPAGG
ncbi:MAG: hypothetical protein ACKN83_11085, partial [Vulcanococcus sp.]